MGAAAGARLPQGMATTVCGRVGPAGRGGLGVPHGMGTGLANWRDDEALEDMTVGRFEPRAIVTVSNSGAATAAFLACRDDPGTPMFEDRVR